MKSYFIRPATANRLGYIYAMTNPAKVTIGDVIEWFNNVWGIKIDAVKNKHTRKYHSFITTKDNVILFVCRRPGFPYRSTKYTLKRDCLEDAINFATTLIDNTLFSDDD